MAEDGYKLSEQAVRKTALAVKRILGTPRTGQGRGHRGFPPTSPPHRTGTVYSTIGAASTTAGTGEVKFDKIERQSLSYIDQDALPERVYNVAPVIFLEGARVLCHWDQSIVTIENGQKRPQAGWVVSDRIGGGAETPDRSIFICGHVGTTMANTAALQPLYLGSAHNFDISTFEVETANQLVVLKRAGYYEVVFNVHFIGNTGGGATNDQSDSFDVYFRNGQILGTSVVSCSAVRLQSLFSYPSGLQLGQNGGSIWYATRGPGDVNSKLDFVAKNIAWANGGTMTLLNARIKYIGDAAPTIANFAAPPPP